MTDEHDPQHRAVSVRPPSDPSVVQPRKRVGRLRRALRTALVVIGTGVTFTIAVASSALLHAGTAPARRVLASQLTQLLDGSFRGKVILDGVGSLGLFGGHGGVAGTRARILDANGKEVLAAFGVRVRANVFGLAKNALTGKGDMRLSIDAIEIDHIEVTLIPDPDGLPSIAHAFDPSPEAAAKPKTAGGRGLDLSLPSIALHHAWIHGTTPQVPLVDVELSNLDAAVRSAPKELSLEAKKLDLLARSLVPQSTAPVVAHLTTRVVLPSDPDGKPNIRATVDATAGQVAVNARGSFVENVVDAEVTVPRADPEAVRALSPQVPIFQPIAAHVVASGELPRIHAKGGAEVGHGAVTFEGDIVASAAMAATAKVNAHAIDIRAFSKDGPESNLNLDLAAHVATTAEGSVDGGFEAHTSPATAAGQVIPAIDAHGDFTKTRAHGAATVHEVGAPTQIAYDAHYGEGGTRVAFETDTNVPSLASIPRIGPVAKGSGRVRTHGNVNVDAMQVEANADVAVANVEASGVQLGAARIGARVTGDAKSPTVAVTIAGERLQQGELKFARLAATANGKPTAMTVTARLEGSNDAPDIAAQAVIHAGEQLVVTGTDVSLKRNDVTARARVESVRSANGRLDVEGILVEGLGAPLYASLHQAPRKLDVTAKSDGLDIARIATLVHKEEDLKGGTLALDTEMSLAGATPKGHAKISIANARLRDIEGGYADLDVTVDGKHIAGTAAAEMDAVGFVNAKADVTIAGAVTDANAWKKALGDVSLDAAANLGAIVAKLPEGTVPVEKLTGKVTMKGSVARTTTDGMPDARISVATHQLAFALPPPAETKAEVDAKKPARDSATATTRDTSPPKTAEGNVSTLTTRPKFDPKAGPQIAHRGFASSNLDVSFDVSLDGASGFTEAFVTAHDTSGVLAMINAKTDIPADMMRTPSRAKELANEMPFAVHVDVPRRGLDKMPEALGQMPAHGDVALGMDLSGTAKAPKVDVGIRAFDLRDIRQGAETALDVTGRATYDGAKGDARMLVVRKDRTVVDAKVDVTAKLDDFKNATPEAPAKWDGNAKIVVDKFALQDVRYLIDDHIRGTVSATVDAKNLGTAPVVDGKIDLGSIKVGKSSLDSGAIVLAAKDGGASVDVRLVQGDGHIFANAKAPIHWVGGAAPSLDTTKSLDASYDISKFRIAVFTPFVRDSLGNLDGRLDGKGTVAIEPGEGAKNGKMQGDLRLTGGQMILPTLGDEVHDVRATVKIDPWGTVRVDDVSLSGVSGKLTATASAKLDGFAVRNGQVSIRINKDEAFPLSMQSVPLGEAWGAIDVKADMSAAQDDLKVAVDIPVLHFTLPQKTGHSVQGMEADESVTIDPLPEGESKVLVEVDPTKVGEAVAAAAPKMKIHVEVNLGKEVEARRDTTLRIGVTGKPVLDIGETTKISGEVRTTEGFLELQGKKFIVEKATVSFVGPDPGNPTVVATAYYDAPDRTRVFADFRGPVQTGKLTLRSDPPLTNSQILSVLLFGSADSSAGAASTTQSSDTDKNTALAVGAAGGVVTQGLNKALSGVSPYEISTRIATNESNNPAPELAVQLSKTVTARIAYNLGQAAPGQNPDKTLLMLDWQFRRRWSTLVTAGQTTSILDLLWRKSY